MVRTADITLSGLASRAQGSARGLILALHGGGYSAGYWHCPVEEGRYSLLNLGSHLGFHVLAVDRPGYGAAHDLDPARIDNKSQVSFLFDVIDCWKGELGFDGPVFVIGHSIGAILTLLMAADPRSARLGGVDVLGVPLAYPPSSGGDEVTSWTMAGAHLPALSDELHKWLLFGPDDSYSAEAFANDHTLLQPMPLAEYRDALAMPAAWPEILPTIRIPVQLTAAEHEVMQVTGREALDMAESLMRDSPNARFHLQPRSGHNASSHHIARAYHMRAIAFFEECIALKMAG
ncbi:alpha/beta fold hydrolase [Phenylobacterium montanum]|uniref:Alpha/beta hydrolase n=1 Tax=Phenylobacterium montanum TaxID=2823693 RepID=A0A975G419_9CAUL|nr:alpha/beta hydrolase [Caulobacter sp. S6]QUD90187.1 alpha/beta hydrolase [Caulobacter sp. S6]